MMSSLELEKDLEKTTVGDNKPGITSENTNSKTKNKKQKKRRSSLRLKRFGCMRPCDDDSPAVEKSTGDGSFNVEAATAGSNGPDHAPTHLIVTVNGIIGSAENWKYAAKQFVKAYPNDIMVHCSESNTSMLTFDGVDVMGTRLADEVLSVIEHHPNLLKISFICHSLGGLIARYAIARLYREDCSETVCRENGENRFDEAKDLLLEEKREGKIAGLDPVNFITSATPHLGCGGHRQVPVFCGFHTLEKVASRSSWLLGRTGRHLFLTDCDNGKPPLLLQMVTDSEDLKFLSALQSFRRRVAYANARFDRILLQ